MKVVESITKAEAAETALSLIRGGASNQRMIARYILECYKTGAMNAASLLLEHLTEVDDNLVSASFPTDTYLAIWTKAEEEAGQR